MFLASGFTGFILLAAVVRAVPVERRSGLSTSTKRAQQLQSNAAWELARLAQPGRLSIDLDDTSGPDGLFPARAGSQDFSFPFDDTWGTGVVVYVVDSGVRNTHAEVTGRVENGFVISRLTGQATEDVCDHGTGVASLLAGTTLGVAKQATIVPVRVADANSCGRVATTTDDVTEGVNLAVADFAKRANAAAGIINISWQWFDTPTSTAALTAAINASMHVVVTAGNFNANQCFGGPANIADQRVRDLGQFMVGATDWADDRLDVQDGTDTVEGTGSNFGSCLTLLAPGASMNVASGLDDTTILHGGLQHSGTSYAAPLVSGVIAALVTTQGNTTPAAMRTLVLQHAAQNVGIPNLQGSPDIILQAPLLSATPQ